MIYSVHITHPEPPPFPYTTLFRSHLGLLGVEHAFQGFLAQGIVIGVFADRPARGQAEFEAETAGERKVETVEGADANRSEEHTSELQSRRDLVCRLLLEKKNN